MSKKVILVCDECLSRNYKTSKNEYDDRRLELQKYCKHCNAKTLHKETR